MQEKRVGRAKVGRAGLTTHRFYSLLNFSCIVIVILQPLDFTVSDK